MVTATIDKLGEKAASVAGRVAASAEFAESLAQDARRAVTRTARELEDLKLDAETRVRKAPLRAVGFTLAAGLLLGAGLGWFAHRASRQAACS